MSDWAFIRHMTNYMTRGGMGDKKPPTLWPSEASAVITNQYGEEEVVGKCRRASFFRYLLDSYKMDPTQYQNFAALVTELKENQSPPDPYMIWIWRAGELYEEHCIGLAKASGVYVDAQTPIYIKDFNVSGKIDVIVINPETGKYSAVECITPNTLINDRDRGLVEADKCVVGDTILDQNGIPVQIKRVFNRTVRNTPVYKFKSKIDGLDCTFSEEHPIWTSNIQIRRSKGPKRQRQYIVTNPQWKKAKDVKEGDYIAVPVPKLGDGIKTLDLGMYISDTATTVRPYTLEREQHNAHKIPRYVETDLDFFRFLGLYTAEGCASGSNLTISFQSSKEQHLIDFCKSYVKRIFGIPASERNHGKLDCRSVTFSSTILADVMRNLAGHLAQNKKFILPLAEMSKEQVSAFVDAWMEGDGCDTDRSKRGYTASPNLAQHVFQCLIGLGFEPNLKKYKQHHTSFGSGNGIWRVQYTPTRDLKLNTMKSPVLDGLKYYKVRNVVVDIYSGPLINFEVTGSNTFLAGGIVTHNCKSVYGHNSDRVMGSAYERRQGNMGTPRDSNLMQIALYQWWFATKDPQFESGRLVYGARDTGRFAEYKIETTPYGEVDPTTNQSHVSYAGIAPNRTSTATSPITIESILAQYKLVSDSLAGGNIPPRDFELQYSDEKIEKMFHREQLGKVDAERVSKRLKQIEEGKTKLNKQLEKGDFNCGWCQFKSVCYDKEGAPREL